MLKKWFVSLNVMSGPPVRSWRLSSGRIAGASERSARRTVRGGFRLFRNRLFENSLIAENLRWQPQGRVDTTRSVGPRDYGDTPPGPGTSLARTCRMFDLKGVRRRQGKAVRTRTSPPWSRVPYGTRGGLTRQAVGSSVRIERPGRPPPLPRE